MIRFGNPDAFLALMLLPAAALLLWLMVARRKAMLSRYASSAVLNALMPNYSRGWAGVRVTVLFITVALAVLAAARPQWGYEDRRIRSRGVDLIVAVDTSLSMLAQDFKPNRLARAKGLLQDILWAAQGERVGVVAFAGDAFVMSPLTMDIRMASMALESINPGTVPVQGTSILAAVQASVRAFETAGKGERVMVLLTDGENQDGQLDAALAAAKAASIRVYTIGIGTSEGMPIPLSDGSYKQDAQGGTVNSKLDFLTLTRLADGTDGKAVRANATGSAEIEPILAQLRSMKAKDQTEMTMRVYTERFQWFLGPAIGLLAFEMLLTGAMRHRRRGPGRVVA